MRWEARRPSSRTAMILGAIASLVAACNGSETLLPVTGKVVFEDGAPVSFGVIEFVPRGGGAAARSAIDRDGRFTLKTAGRLGAVGGEQAGNTLAKSASGARDDRDLVPQLCHLQVV